MMHRHAGHLEVCQCSLVQVLEYSRWCAIRNLMPLPNTMRQDMRHLWRNTIRVQCEVNANLLFALRHELLFAHWCRKKYRHLKNRNDGDNDKYFNEGKSVAASFYLVHTIYRTQAIFGCQ